MQRRPRPRFAAVIFDNDGLLLDTELAWTVAEEQLFASYGFQFTREHKRELLGTSRVTAAGKLERLLDQPGRGGEIYDELTELVLVVVAHTAPPRPGAVELLARLRTLEMPLGLASNSPRRFVDRALATAGIDANVFAVTRAGDEVAHPKPAPDIYLEVCAALGAEPASTLVLEDSPPGVAAALAAGCYTIAIPSIEGVELVGAMETLPSLTDVGL